MVRVWSPYLLESFPGSWFVLFFQNIQSFLLLFDQRSVKPPHLLDLLRSRRAKVPCVFITLLLSSSVTNKLRAASSQGDVRSHRCTHLNVHRRCKQSWYNEMPVWVYSNKNKINANKVVVDRGCTSHLLYNIFNRKQMFSIENNRVERASQNNKACEYQVTPSSVHFPFKDNNITRHTWHW